MRSVATRDRPLDPHQTAERQEGDEPGAVPAEDALVHALEVDPLDPA